MAYQRTALSNILHNSIAKGIPMRIAVALYLLVVLPSVVSAQTTSPNFFQLEIDGGFLVHGGGGDPVEGQPDTHNHKGWRVASEFKPFRMAGIVAEVGRTWNDVRPFKHYLAGGRVGTSSRGADGPVHYFAHGLLGMAEAGAYSNAPAEKGLEFVVGGGIDVAILRMQLDYMRLSLRDVPANQGRFFIGGVIPLCFRGCTKDDGFDLSKGR